MLPNLGMGYAVRYFSNGSFAAWCTALADRRLSTMPRRRELSIPYQADTELKNTVKKGWAQNQKNKNSNINWIFLPGAGKFPALRVLGVAKRLV